MSTGSDSAKVCAAMGCGQRATHMADIYDGVSETPTMAPYCAKCADVLDRNGENVWEIPTRTAADELEGAITTLGERLWAAEADRDRYRRALKWIFGYAYGASGVTGDDAGHLTAVGMHAKKALDGLLALDENEAKP
jgi:hypothetical protein